MHLANFFELKKRHRNRKTTLNNFGNAATAGKADSKSTISLDRR
jgi:hypothetical protein